MTDKLHCPFCGEEIKIAGERTTIMSCFNGDCYGSGLYGEEAMWKALIDGKKAQDALKELKSYYDVCKKGHEKGEDIDWRALIETTVDKITSITKQADK